MVRRVNSNVYIFVSMTLNTTHVRGNGGYNGGMTLKLSRCVRIMYLHMCAKFQVSMVNSCRENPDWGGGFRFSKMRFSFKFSSKFRRVKFLFLNQHVPNRLPLPSDDWRQHCRPCFSPEKHFRRTWVPVSLLVF